MKVGDKRQAVILGVVAVGAVVFLFTQLKGKGGPPNSVVAAANTPAVEASNLGDVKLPRSLYGDPFSHPALAKLASNEKVQSTPSSQPSSGNSEIAPIDPKRLPWATGFIEGAPLRQAPPDAKKPAMPKVVKAAPKLPILYLAAIVSAGQPIALITLDDGPATKFTQGQSVAPGIAIKAIHDDSVTLSVTGHAGLITLSVGNKLQP